MTSRSGVKEEDDFVNIIEVHYMYENRNIKHIKFFKKGEER
jgi:hypothetical protein